MSQPTIDACLELLAADFTGQVSQAQLLVQLYHNRILMVTEKTGECGSKRFPLLELVSLSLPLTRKQAGDSRTFRGPWG